MFELNEFCENKDISPLIITLLIITGLSCVIYKTSGLMEYDNRIDEEYW